MEYYGVNVGSNIKFKDNASVIFMDEIYLKGEYERNSYRNYCDDGGLNYDDDSSKEEFVDSYENDTLYGGYVCRGGLEQLLADYINDREFAHEETFKYDEIILEEMPDAHKDSIVATRIKIKKILAKYFSPLVEEPVSATWYYSSRE